MTHYICKYTPVELLRALGGECVVLDQMPDSFPLSDQLGHPNLCGFGKDTKMNVPGVPNGNWAFRLSQEQMDGIDKDYIKLAYAGTDTLYLPATQLDSISKYIGGGDDTQHKKLSKLGGTEWERAKSRTRAAVKDLATGEQVKLPPAEAIAHIQAGLDKLNQGAPILDRGE